MQFRLFRIGLDSLASRVGFIVGFKTLKTPTTANDIDIKQIHTAAELYFEKHDENTYRQTVVDGTVYES